MTDSAVSSEKPHSQGRSRTDHFHIKDRRWHVNPKLRENTVARKNLSLEDKRKRLLAIIEGYDALAVAFSGGVDSTFLLAAAKEVLGDRLIAITAESPVHAQRESREAAEIAGALGVQHIRVPSGELAVPDFIANPPHRCYICKQHVFSEVIRIAAERGIRRVAHGVNLDDLGDFRPGLKAAEEMGVLTPLVEAGLNKAEIRTLSRRMRLPTWNKASMACLASRIPYGRRITPEVLKMVEAAEDLLFELGFFGCRVRHHGDVARIELAAADLRKVMSAPMRAKILEGLRTIGFKYIAVDLEGYVSGSLNRVLEKKSLT